jgi:hypothetical protein
MRTDVIGMAAAIQAASDRGPVLILFASIAGAVLVGGLSSEMLGKSGQDREVSRARRIGLGVVIVLASACLVTSIVARAWLTDSAAAWWSAFALAMTTIAATLLYRLHFGLGVPRPHVTTRSLGYGLLVLATFLAGGAILGRGTPEADSLTSQMHVVHGVYAVMGTCPDGLCGGIREYTEPSMDSPVANDLYHRDDELLAVSCQIEGDVVRTRRKPVQRSPIWDRLANGNYVSDLYVNTRGEGERSPSLPRCSRTP